MAKKIDLDGLEHFKQKENASIAGTESSSTASKAYKVGEYFYFKGTLVVCTSPITSGGTITLNTNCKTVPLADEVSDLKTAIVNKIGRIEKNINSYNYFEELNVALIDVTGQGAYRAGCDCGILPQGNYVLTFNNTSGSTTQLIITSEKNNTYTQSNAITSPYYFSVDGETRIIIRSNAQNLSGWTFYNVTLLNEDSIVVSDEIEKISSYFVFSKNLFDKSAVTKGKYLNNNNGSVADNSGMFVSDYIPIEIGKSYTFPVDVTFYGETSAKRTRIYNSNKTDIGYITGTLNNGILTINVSLSFVGSTISSSDMKYLRWSNAISLLDNIMLVEGNTYPNTYEPYGYNRLSNKYSLNEKQIEQIAKITNSGLLAGKKIVYNGDSIAESRLQNTSAYNGGAYAKIIADLTGGTYENRAISGGILASAPGDGGSVPSRCVVSDVTNMADDADLICFEGGINDYWRDVSLGNYSESDYTGTLDTTTVCGALESIFRQATEKWVGKPIVFVIVHKIKDGDSGATAYAVNHASTPYTFAQEREKMIGICNKYAIPFYDAYAESGLNAYNTIQNTTFLTGVTGSADGCHPNEAGYRRYYVPQLIALFESVMPRLEEESE